MDAVEQQFTAWLRGVVDPSRPAFIEVPPRVMRAFPWGRYLRVRAEVNGVPLESTIINVGWGPSLLVPPAVRKSLALGINARVDVRIRPARA